MRAEFQTKRRSRALSVLLIGGIFLFAGSAELFAQSPDEDKARIEKEYGRSFSDVVRLNYWSVFERADEFAGELGISRERLDALLEKHAWDLKAPPALKFQNTLDSERVKELRAVSVSSKQQAETGAFVDRSRQVADPGSTAEIQCDGNRIVITVTCRELNPAGMAVKTPIVDNRPEKERAFWDGDFAAIKPLLYQGMSQEDERKWALGLKKPSNSVLTDECVVVCLTPVGVGKDWSMFELTHLAPDPEELRSQLKPRPTEENRVFMEGAWYYLAVNPNGALLDGFFDPWGGGTMSPAWKSEARVETSISEQGWTVTMEIPWNSLRPTVGKGSVWGVDVSRLRRQENQSAEVSRTAETTLVYCDVDRMNEGFRNARKNDAGNDGAPELPSIDLNGAEPLRISRLTDRQGRSSDRTQVQLTHNDARLTIRFECEEPSLSRLGVVTREEEDRAYGPGNRKTNYLDRRENWGIGWGDYVEVLVSPDLAESDPYHAGLFQFLVNSDGNLLERYYDSFGMFTVMPHPDWDSGVRVMVEKDASRNRWSVELAIPFSALCEPGRIPQRWGLNFHRCVSAGNASTIDSAWMWRNESEGKLSRGGELDLFWSPPEKLIRDANRFGWLTIDPEKVKPVAESGTRPGSAPGRDDRANESGSRKRDRSGDRLASVCFVDATYGWAAGGLGTILHTRDGGATWDEQDSGVNFLLEKVHFIDREHGWAVGGWPRDYELAIFGGMGVILATRDGGANWEIQLDSVGGWLSGLTFLDRKNGWAVGEFGTVWKTTDGGEHWEQMRKVPTPGWLYDIHFVDESRGWTVGRFEAVLSTKDGGESWTPQRMPALDRPFGLSLNFRAVSFANPQQGWIVGQHGNILHTSDGGRNWSREAISVNEKLLEIVNLNDLSVTGADQVRAVSQFGLFRRNSASKAWELIPTGMNGWWRSVHFVDETRGWITGDRGTMMSTEDGGKSWRKHRDSGRRMGVVYASPHDHHINNSAMTALGEEFDTAYLLMGRSVNWPFQMGGDINTHKADAVTAAMGVTVGYNFNEFGWRGRDSPHHIAERYQHHRGLEAIEQRLVAAIRCLKPMVVVGEQPVMQEGYYAHGVGDVARAMVAAFDSAGDPDRFPELAELGLEPFSPKKFYLRTMWPNEMYDVHPMTLHLPPKPRLSRRLGMSLGEATLMGRQVFWGLLDRGRPPETQKPWPGSWSLHLKASRVDVAEPEIDLFGGLR